MATSSTAYYDDEKSSREADTARINASFEERVSRITWPDFACRFDDRKRREIAMSRRLLYLRGFTCRHKDDNATLRRIIDVIMRRRRVSTRLRLINIPLRDKFN